MTDEERRDFMDGLPKDIIWKMAEGNPANATALTGKDGAPIRVEGIDISFKEGNGTGKNGATALFLATIVYITITNSYSMAQLSEANMRLRQQQYPGAQ